MYKKILFILVSAIFLSQLISCDRNALGRSGLYLPLGNAENGRLAFISLQCHACHTVTGVALPPMKMATPVINFNLGGAGSRVKSYSGLVTAIINPAHFTSSEYVESLNELTKTGKIESPMPSLNDKMTVTQMIDIVAFLDARYEELLLEYMGRVSGNFPD